MGRSRRVAPLLYVSALAAVAAAWAGEPRAEAQTPAAVSSPRAPAPSPSPSRPPAAVLVLEGTVVGPDGKPVVGALVSVQAALLYGYPEPAVTARTDAAGRFRVPVKTAAAQTVRVEAPGLAARLLPRVRPGEPVRIALDKGGSIEGIVRDGTTGEPAAAITVEARQEATRGVGMVWEPGAGLVRATTDAQGRFRLDGLAAGLHTLAARGRGVSGARRGIGIGKRAEIYVFPGSGLHATVSGPDGRAVAGAKVALENATPFGGRSADVQVSDARGRIEFVGIDPGVYRVVARHPDFAPAWTTVTVERSGDATADLTLAPPAAIVGRLVGAEDRPVRGRVAVAETDGAAPPPFSLAPTLAVETAEDGRFRLDTVPPGSYVLSATAPGYGARRAEAVVGGTQRVTDVGDITLETGLVIRGHVREAGGAPIADARVGVFRFPPTGGDDRAEGRSAADGSFALGGLRAGGYRVTVNAPGHGMANREVDAPAEGVDFVLDAAGSLTGMVVDERGRPVETIRVQARVPPAPSGPGGGMMMTSPRFEALSSSDGRFVVDEVTPGTYVVEVSAPERATATVSNVKVPPGAAADVGRVVLGAGGIVRGTVADAAGAGVPAAVVTYQGAGRSFGPSPTSEAVTDPAGAFELRGVPSGPIQVTARHPSFAEGRASADVDPAKEAPEVRITLLQGGRIEGRARRRDGSPLTGAVNMHSRASGFSAGPGSMTPLSPDGTFAMEHVPSGTVTVMLMEGTAGQLTSTKSREVDVVEGQTATVEFVARDILVTGRVTRGGSAAPNLRLRASGGQFGTMMFSMGGAPAAPAPAGPQRMTAVTRDDGSYEMLVDEPGKGTVSVSTFDGSASYPSQPVEFPDADTFTFDIALPAASIAGVVVDRETDQPLAKVYVVAMPPNPERTARAGMGMMPSSATTGTDGRFRLDVEPGEYRLSARAQGFTGEPVTVTVGESGTNDVRVALSRGTSIRGRVVDARGQGVAGLNVVAYSSEGEAPRFGGGTMSLGDGSFEIGGLGNGDYSLASQSELGLFAMRPGVAAGSQDVTLTLRRGGRALVTVLGPDGAPVRGAFASVRRVSGHVLFGMGGGMPTDARGTTEFNVPVGAVEIRATTKEGLEGVATLGVSEGAMVAAEIRLAPPKEAPAPR